MTTSRYRVHAYQLRDDVRKEEYEYGVAYHIPIDMDTVHRVFDDLHRALWSLQPIADNKDDDSYSSAMVYAKRRFGRIYKKAYDYEFEEKDAWRLPTVKDVHSDIRWFDEIEPRTFIIEKTDSKLILRYEEGFRATDDTITIGKNEINKVKYSALHACGDGIKDEHAPYNPNWGEKWRYKPSKVSVSIESEGSDVRLGISNDTPKKPWWYRAYKHLSVTGDPYAYATFNMDNQTSVVKYTHNQNYEPEV